MLVNEDAADRLFRHRGRRLTPRPSILAESGSDVKREQKGLVVKVQPSVWIGVDLDAGHLSVVVDQQRKLHRLASHLCLVFPARSAAVITKSDRTRAVLRDRACLI